MLPGIVNGRILLGIGSLARLSVGVGYLAFPEAMARRATRTGRAFPG